MMILKQKQVKLANEYTNTRMNPDLTSVIYLTTVKVAQYREVDENRIEKEEAKKVTAKKKATRKVHLHFKQSEAFDRCINSTNNIFSSNTYE